MHQETELEPNNTVESPVGDSNKQSSTFLVGEKELDGAGHHFPAATLPESRATDADPSHKSPESERKDIPLRGPGRFREEEVHLGSGAYGVVKKAEDLLTGELVAVKKVVLQMEVKEDQKLIRPIVSLGIDYTVYREIKVMKELKHDNVITLIDVYVSGDFVNLVMPMMTTDLSQIFAKSTRLHEAQQKSIIKQILEGVNELHKNFFLHRDLSPANVFVDHTGCFKVADFGLSRSYGSPKPTRKTHMVVTLWYRAPELLMGCEYYQDRVDIWSVGCILAQALRGGKPLFVCASEIELLGKIFALLGTPTIDEDRNAEEPPNKMAKTETGAEKQTIQKNWPKAYALPNFIEFTYAPPQKLSDILPPGVSSQALDLLTNLLQLDPTKRISAEEALKHPWFKTPPLPPARLPALAKS